MSGLPTGTVTFVFTDIEGSTSLLKALGDDYGEVLSTHRRLMRDCFGTRGGVEIDTQGDAFFFAFPRARDAVSAAVGDACMQILPGMMRTVYAAGRLSYKRRHELRQRQ